MIGNDRLYLAVLALATAEGDARARVCLAMSIIEPLRKIEFEDKPHLWVRLKKLEKGLSYKGPQIVNKKILKDSYLNTALHRHNKTYAKYAREIMSTWLETCE